MAAIPEDTPATIGPYQVVRPLARGGMAAVYEVKDARTGQRLALKLLTQVGLARPRFAREYRALMRLDHPNILRVYRYGLTKDRAPYLIMELLEGVAAQVHAKSCGRPGTPRRTAEVLRIATAVADALGYLHERGIIHRDLKSSNVMVLRDGRVKLLDFGTARLLGSEEEITRHGEFVGTFAYASPEQLTGGPVDARSDIYSLAVLFYRLLTGRRPFEGDTPHEVARRHLDVTPPTPAELVAGVPARASALIMSMLAKEPSDRPQSAWSVVRVLRDLGVDLAPSGDSTRALSEPEVIGRDTQVRALRSVFAKARPGRVVVLSGALGSGRGRLLAQAARDAASLGWRVLEAAFPGPRGLGAVEVAVRAGARGLPLPEGSRQDPDLAVISRNVLRARAASGAQAQVFEAVVRVLRRRLDADGQPLALFLRAAQHASPLALHALQVIRREAAAHHLPIVLVLSTNLDGDAAGRALRGQFPDATRIPLGPLDAADVGKLVGSILGRSAPPPVLARRIHRAAGGLPGTVVEVVHAMVRQGLVEPRRLDDDRVDWMDRSGGRIAIPPSVRDVVEQRLAGLGAAELRLLSALAVGGGLLCTEVLALASDLPQDVAVEHLEQLRDSRLIEADDAGSWRFRLGLTEQIVAERIRASRRALLQKRLAEALWEFEPSAQKIRLLLASGNLAQAVRDAERWAEDLLIDRRAAEVLPILERLVERVHEARELTPTEISGLFLAHATALGLVSAGDDRALASLDRAQALAAGEQRTAVSLERARYLQRRGRGGAARTLIERELARPVSSELLRGRLHLSLGRTHVLAGDNPQALGAYEVARGLAEGLADVRLLGESLVGSGIVRGTQGLLAQAESDLERAISAFASIGNDQGQWHAAVNLSDTLRIQGRFTEALRVIEPFQEAAREGGRPYRYAGLLLNLAETRIELFRLGEVREILSELDGMDIAHSDPYVRAAVALLRGRLELAAGDHGAATSVLEPAMRAAQAAELPVLALQLEGYLGESLGRAGGAAAGDLHGRHALEGLTALGQVPAAAAAAGCLARAWGPSRDPELAHVSVLPWLNSAPARLFKMNWFLVYAEFARGRGDGLRGRDSLQEAAALLDEIRSLLGPADQAALRVHPWTVQIERGLSLG